MLKKVAIIVSIAILTESIGCASYCLADQKISSGNFDRVTMPPMEGVVSEAAYFAGSSRQAVAFFRTLNFTKEDWYPLAKQLQQMKVGSLCVDSGAGHDVIHAIKFLSSKGFQNIALVGGSAAGRVILNTLSESLDERVNKMVLLAPMGGTPLKNNSVQKLILVGKKDPMGLYAYMLKDQISEPKIFKEYDTPRHAQHLLSGEFKEEITQAMLTFLVP